MDWFNTCISRELCYGLIYPQFLPHHQRQDAQAQAQTLAWGREKARRWLRVLNDDLLGASNNFVCGEHITLADYLGIAMLTLGEVVHLDYSPWPNIQRWIARMKAMDSWEPVNAAFYGYMVAPCANLSFVTFDEAQPMGDARTMLPAA
jgi:glutathione S-transferase